MKKLFLIVFILCIGFIGNVKEITACGPGQTTSTHYGIWINGCEYAVTMCYSCGLFSMSQVELISYWKVDPYCLQTMSDQAVLDRVFEIAYSWDFLKQYICVSLEISPCEGEGINIKHIKPTCMQKYRDSQTNTIRYIQCIAGTNDCEETYRYCWQPGIGRVEVFLPPAVLVGNWDGCPSGTDIPTDPPIGGQWPFSDCFSVPTKCNP